MEKGAASADRMRIVLELDPGRRPPQGSVRGETLPARAFSGWIALVAAIESALEAAVHEAGAEEGR